MLMCEATFLAVRGFSEELGRVTENGASALDILSGSFSQSMREKQWLCLSR